MATTYAITWPLVVDRGRSNPVTLTLDAAHGSTATFTASDGGAGGTFAPSSPTIAAGQLAATVGYTPAAVGTVNVQSTVLTVASSSGLADPAPHARTFAVTRWGELMPGWAANMLSYTRAHYPGPPPAGHDFPAAEDGPDADVHYDPIEVWEAIRRYTGDTSVDDCIAAAKYQWIELWSLLNMGRATPYHAFSRGLRDHYVRTGSAPAREALYAWATASLAGDPAGLSAYVDQYTSREVAHTSLTMLDSEDAGMAHRPSLETYVNAMLGHANQWLIPEASRPQCWFIQPFMVGLSMRALIFYWDRYRETTHASLPKLGNFDGTAPNLASLATLQAVIGALLDLLWTGGHQGVNESVRNPFFYPTCNLGPGSTSAGTYGPAGTGAWGYGYPFGPTRPAACGPDAPSTIGHDCSPLPSSVLNPLIAPAYHWYYQRTGDDTYRVRGDQAFVGSNACLAAFQNPAANMFCTVKTFNQSYLWTTHSVAWRARVASPWPAATAVTLTAPASGARVNEPSAPFVVALAGPSPPVAASAPATLTFDDGGAGGRFLPPTVILSTDSPASTFRYAAASAGVKSIGAAVVGGTLAAPARVAYTPVGTATLATGYAWSIAAGANGPKQAAPPVTLTLTPAGSIPPAAADALGGFMRFSVAAGYNAGAFSPGDTYLTAAMPTREILYFEGATTDPRSLAIARSIGLAAAWAPVGGTPAALPYQANATATPSAYTVTPPSPASGPAGAPSGPWTVRAIQNPINPTGGNFVAVIVTPTDGAGGTSTPATVALYGVNRVATFAYAPAGSPGTRSVAFAHAAAGTEPEFSYPDPAPATYTVTGSGGGGGGGSALHGTFTLNVAGGQLVIAI